MPIELPPHKPTPQEAIVEVVSIKQYPFKLTNSQRLLAQNKSDDEIDFSDNVVNNPLEQGIQDSGTLPKSEEINNTEAMPLNIPALSGQAQSEFNSRAIWGPIQAGLVHDPKHTFADIFSNNVGDLSKKEFKQLKDVLDFILSTPNCRKRFVELTQISEEDLDHASKNLDRNKFVFTKLVKLAISTSTQRRVSTQIGGLLQFIEETSELNGSVIPEDYKFKLIRGIPETAEVSWASVLDKCTVNPQECKAKYLPLMDMNKDGVLDQTDVALANNSIQLLKSRMSN